MKSDDLFTRSAEVTADGRTVIGRAVSFDHEYPVFSHAWGRFVESYDQRAFDRSLSHKDTRPLLIGHSKGDLPVGLARFFKEADALMFEARLGSSERADEVLELVAMGALTDVSVGFRGIEPRGLTRGRIHRTQVALQELSFVGVGALEDAKVLALRSQEDMSELQAMEDERRRLRIRLLDL
ncbi:MAG: HK97 family phage prohead protease [Acidimicrobiales bacterium]|nr:HK97 family phage prohead protease [Acidimicrobiales bacterium]MCB9393810.1 HK97 family phage prohead protease [Acidimicrobiaceae bacterium]